MTAPHFLSRLTLAHTQSELAYAIALAANCRHA